MHLQTDIVLSESMHWKVLLQVNQPWQTSVISGSIGELAPLNLSVFRMPTTLREIDVCVMSTVCSATTEISDSRAYEALKWAFLSRRILRGFSQLPGSLVKNYQ